MFSMGSNTNELGLRTLNDCLCSNQISLSERLGLIMRPYSGCLPNGQLVIRGICSVDLPLQAFICPPSYNALGQRYLKNHQYTYLDTEIIRRRYHH